MAKWRQMREALRRSLYLLYRNDQQSGAWRRVNTHLDTVGGGIVCQTLQHAEEVLRALVRYIPVDVPVAKKIESERTLGALETGGPNAGADELIDMLIVTCALAILDLAAVDAVGVHHDEVHRMGVLGGVFALCVSVGPEVDDVSEFCEVYALEVPAVPALDPVVVEVLVVAKDAVDTLRWLLATLLTSRSGGARATCARPTDVAVVFARKQSSDDVVLPQ